MNWDFVTYELAVKLNRKGFDKDTVHYYNELGQICVSLVDEEYPYPCPTISKVLKWLREEKGIFVDIRFNRHYQLYKYYVFTMSAEGEDMYGEYPVDTYEQAALAGIEYCLDNLIEL